MSPTVTRLRAIDHGALSFLLKQYSLQLSIIEAEQDIPGSYWGDEEAGLINHTLYARPDTPIHSILHEACHYICMDEPRRRGLHTDAGGDDEEENAVCYLQVLLADQLDGYDRQTLFKDMDAWGYSFRLGSAQQWFEQDAEDTQKWLVKQQLIDHQNLPLFILRR